MNTINEWSLQTGETFRYKFVGRNHIFFNQIICKCGFIRIDVYRLPICIKLNLGFWEIKVKSAGCDSSGGNLFRQNAHRLQIRKHFCVIGRRFSRRKHCIYGLIISSQIGFYHTFKYVAADAFPGRCIIQTNGQCQPIHLRVQATNSIRKPYRQHRHYSINWINTRTASGRLHINRTVLFHIMTDISNMYVKPVAAGWQNFY